ncbi:MAG: metallophosphoesterase [Pseudomonadota bacterium]
MRLFAFLAVFVTLYGLLHFYAFIKIRGAFDLSRGVSIPLACLLLFMVFSPVIVRVLERFGLETSAWVLAHMGYIWMGVLFLFVCTSFLIDLYHLSCTAGAWLLGRNLDRWFLTSRSAFLIAAAASTLAAIYGGFEAANIRTEQITIRSPKIPKELGRFRIIQISDLHLGQIVGEERLEKILTKVREARPDILVSTGDLLDAQTDNISKVADMIRAVSTPYGKFAVTGNHEFYAGLERSLAFMEDAGFNVLRGDIKDIRGVILVAGVDDDEAANRFGLPRTKSEAQLLSHLPADRFVLLLKHRPLLDRASNRHFDLQLSGHTHGGQIFPFTLLIKMLYPVDAGLLKLQDGAFLYVSRGSGTWGPPIRFLNPPEITVIDLVHEKNEG